MMQMKRQKGWREKSTRERGRKMSCCICSIRDSRLLKFVSRCIVADLFFFLGGGPGLMMIQIILLKKVDQREGKKV